MAGVVGGEMGEGGGSASAAERRRVAVDTVTLVLNWRPRDRSGGGCKADAENPYKMVIKERRGGDWRGEKIRGETKVGGDCSAVHAHTPTRGTRTRHTPHDTPPLCSPAAHLTETGTAPHRTSS